MFCLLNSFFKIQLFSIFIILPLFEMLSISRLRFNKLGQKTTLILSNIRKLDRICQHESNSKEKNYTSLCP